MIALVVGIIFILFALFAGLPLSWGLDWWPEVLVVLKGGVPILAIFIGFIAFFIGIADIKDKIAAKKEEAEEEDEDDEENGENADAESGKPDSKEE